MYMYVCVVFIACSLFIFLDRSGNTDFGLFVASRSDPTYKYFGVIPKRAYAISGGRRPERRLLRRQTRVKSFLFDLGSLSLLTEQHDGGG